MKFFMFSQCGEGAQILHRICAEGNEVALYIKENNYRNVFDGLLSKTDPHSGFIDDDTIIIFDGSGNGKVADALRKQSYKVFGSSCFADELEQDREYGYDIMKKSGIKIPDYKSFTNWKEAQKYVRETNKKLVFKPSGSIPCKLTYCAGSAEEMLAYLQFVEKRYKKDIKEFILQDFIEGCVISSEYFCDGDGLIWPPNQTVEVKKIMNGDLGPSTGCSGNLIWFDHNSIISNGIEKIEDCVKENNYIGQIDLNTVVNSFGIYGLEFTPRFGYDSMPTFLTSLKMDFGQFFSDICNKQLKEIDLDGDKFYSSIRITIPPYPIEVEEKVDTEDFSPNTGVPILNWKENEEEIYFYEVMLDDNILQHSGGTGVVCLSLGSGNDAVASFERPCEIAEALVIPDKQYRTDLKEVLPDMYSKAKEFF